jgi:hypothetical protein
MAIHRGQRGLGGRADGRRDPDRDVDVMIGDPSREVIADIVRDVLVEYGHACDHLPDDGPELIVDVNQVAVIVAGKLSLP